MADVDARHTALTTPKRLTLDERNDCRCCVDARQHTGDLRSRIGTGPPISSSSVWTATLPNRSSSPRASKRLARVTSDGRWVLYTDEAEKPIRIMRVPLVGGRPEPLVTYPPGAGGSATARFTVVVCFSNAVRPWLTVSVFALDPIRGKQQELTQIPSSVAAARTSHPMENTSPTSCPRSGGFRIAFESSPFTANRRTTSS